MFESLESRTLFSTAAVVTVAPVTASEPADGSSTPAVFTATLRSAAAAPVTLTYATANRTAKAGVDYTATTGSIVIPAGATSGTFSVPVLGNDVSEPTLTFLVHLKASAGARVNATAVGTILDTTGLPTVTVSDTEVPEPAAKARSNASVVVDLSNPSSRKVVVYLHTVNDTAVFKTDYVALTRAVTFKPGQTSAAVALKVVGETTPPAADEVFEVAVTRATLASLDTPVPTDLFGRVVIRAADVVRPTLAVSSPAVVAGGTATFTASLSAPSAEPVSFRYDTEPGTATTADYTPAGGIVTIPAGQTSATITVPTTADPTAQSTEAFSLALTGAANAGLAAATAAATILPDTPEPSLSVADASGVEDPSGTSTLTFTVTLSAASTRAVTVDYATADGTAVAGQEYDAATGTITIPAGQTTATVPVTILAVGGFEPDETFTLNLSDPTDATLATPTATGTILNDDTASATLSVASATVTVGTAGTATLPFTVTLSAAQASAVTVDYATANGTATAGTDYTATAGTLTIAAGQTTGTIDVPVAGPAVTAESSKTLTVTLSSPTGAALATTTATGTIVDDDIAGTTLPSVSVAPAAVTASSSATTLLAYTVTLSSAATSAVTVTYATANGTATAGTDYAAVVGVLTIPAGSTTGTVDVTVDAETSATAATAKTLTLTLTSPDGATLGTAAATGTINIPAAGTATTLPTVGVAATSVTASSTATTTLVFTVSLSAAQTSAATVRYATSNGTATAGTDYVAAAGTLTIAAGQTTATVSVTVDAEASAAAAATKTLTLTLSAPTNATLGAAAATGTINIAAAGSTGTGSTTDLADNLSQTPDSYETATGNNWLAASFTTTSAVSVTGVTLPLAMTTSGAVTLSIYTDGGLEPGTLVGTLASPSSFSATSADATFTGSVALSAGTTYWVVLQATSGAFNWYWTDSTTGTGTGFTGEWSQSSNAGTTWFSDDNYPLQMQVLVS